MTSLLLLSLLAAEPSPRGAEVKVIETGTFVYAEPDVKASVLRRLYMGELLRVTGEVTAPDGSHWLAVSLGADTEGFVRKEKLGPTDAVPAKKWEPAYIVRDERPLVLGARFGGETLGAGINLRYQPFTRVGLSLTTAVLIDPVQAKSAVGPVFAFGFYSAILLFNVSPVIELGIQHATYSVKSVSLNLLNFYASMGVEWMLDNGFYLHVYATYVRSIDISASVPLSALNGGAFERPSFGWLDSYAQVGNALNLFMPGFAIGYAF